MVGREAGARIAGSHPWQSLSMRPEPHINDRG